MYNTPEQKSRVARSVVIPNLVASCTYTKIRIRESPVNCNSAYNYLPGQAILMSIAMLPELPVRS